MERTEGSIAYQATLGDASLGRALNLQPQDRPRWPGGLQLLASLLSLLLLVTVVRHMDGVNLGATLSLVPKSALFWLLFAAAYLALPFGDWLIFRKLWNVGPSAFGALVRKLVYNELLLDYLGDAYFYSWSRKNVRLHAAPFGAVKDVAILSAMAANAITLIMVLVAWPAVSASQLGMHTRSVLLSLTLVLITSFGALFLRRSIFSLPAAQLRAILIIHSARLIAGVILSALLWHLALPVVPLVFWVILATIRLLIARLPFLPNKEVVFAGVAVFMLGHEVEIAALLTLMAGLILATHLLVGGAFALSDLVPRESRAR